MHGGPKGFDDVEWKVSDPSKATLFSEKELASLTGIESAVLFLIVSEDGDQGFPGKLLTEVVMALLPSNGKASADGEKTIGSILFVYRAKVLDGKKVVTPVNLTQARKSLVNYCVLSLNLSSRSIGVSTSRPAFRKDNRQC